MTLLLSLPPLAGLCTVLIWLQHCALGLIITGVFLGTEFIRDDKARSLEYPFEELSFAFVHFEIGLRNILGWAEPEAQRNGAGLRPGEIGKMLG